METKLLSWVGALSLLLVALPSAAAPAKEKKKADAKVQKLTAGGPTLQYEQFRKTVELKVAEKRDEQIAGLQRLLDLGAQDKEIPDIKFRLAELYYEKSRFYFFRSQEADEKAGGAKSAGEKSEAEDDRKKNQKESKAWARRATEVYKEIRDKYPKYERMPEVLFALGQSYWSEGNFQAAIEVYADLIKNFKDSPLVAEAWIAFGEYYFGEGDVNKALKSYEKAAEDKRSRVYGFALYKQAWCWYNLSEWKKALSKFKATVYYSQLSDQLSGENKIALGKEAQKDFVRTYAHIGDAPRARFEIADLLGKEECNDDACLALLEQLAGLWYDDGYFDESALLYGQLIKLKPNNSRNPFFQGKIVDLVARGPDKNRTIAESRRLVEVYEQTKSYVAGMTGDPKVVAKAKDDVREAAEQAEATIRKYAQLWNQEAKKTRQPKTYEFAKTMYEEYIKLFPSTKFSYEIRFQLADLYYKLEMFDEAAREYEATVKADPKGQYLVEAANDNILAVEERIKDIKIAKPKAADKPQEIHKEKVRLIEACDRYVQFVPADKADKLVSIKYKAAKIYYDYSHRPEALKRFDDIVSNNPDAKEAEVAANLIFDMFNEAKDWRSIYDYSVRYSKIEALLKDREKLSKDILGFGEYAKFKLVQILEEGVQKNGGDLRQVATAYAEFYQEYPKSENADKALFNASVAFDKIGDKKTANKLREKLLKEFPGSPLGADVAYYVAKANEERTNYKLAGKQLAAFAKKYPEDKRARDALYNAAVFYAGVGDVREANKLREEYLGKYGKLKEGEKEAAAIYYSSARDLETSGRYADAAKRYDDFVKNFPDATQVWDALHNAATIRRDKLRQTKDAEKLDGVILGNYERLSKKGSQLPREAGLYASLVAFNRLEQDWTDYKKIRLVPPNVRNPTPFQRSLEDKAKGREKVIRAYTTVVTKYQQPDSTIASLYRIAEAYDEFVKAVVGIPCPRGLSEDVCAVIREELEKKAGPARESAFAAYKTCVAKSNELNVFTPYSTRCVKALEVLAPESYPPMMEKPAPYESAEESSMLSSNSLVLQPNGYSHAAEGDGEGPDRDEDQSNEED